MANRKLTKHIVLHCSATRPGQVAGVKEIREWHKARGWKDIGYHYVIRRNGNLEVGRKPDSSIGSHVANHNSNTLGVCLEGGLDASTGRPVDNFTDAQWDSLRGLLAKLLEKYPGATILGHRDLSPDKDGDGVVERHEWLKDCPCFDARTWARRNGFPAAPGGEQTTAPVKAASDSPGMLQMGDKGSAVAALQADLKSLGYNDVGEVDGKFGNKTRDMVKALQTDRGLIADGKVGPKTWESLRTDRTPRHISVERQTATVEDLRAKGSSIVHATDNLKTVATVAALGTGGTASYQAATESADPTTVSQQLSTTAEKALENAERARDGLDRATDIAAWVTGKFGSVLAWFIERPWLLVGVGLAAAVWWYANRAQQQRVEMHRQGRD